MKTDSMKGALSRFLGVGWVLVAAVAPLAACGSELEGVDVVEDSSETTSAIIGGSAVSVATRRSMGLVETANGCSGTLITPHWVMTAAHCLDTQSPSNNRFSAPRPDGTLETRVGQVISRVGLSDIALVNLAPSQAAPNWPSVARTMLRTPTPSQMVGQFVTCYGRGATAYASPSGLKNAGPWRSLVKQVARSSGGNLFIDAANGDQIPATGDSGGPCLFGGQVAAVISSATNFNCANAATPATCDSTVTKINTVALQSTTPYADYIDFAGSRVASTFFPLQLQGDWTNAAFGDNVAGYAVFDSTVHLRGAIAAASTSTLAFVLPSNATPPFNVYAPVTLCDAGKGRLFIETNGRVTVHIEGSDWSKAQCLVSLEGVSFPRSSFGVPALALKNGWTTTPYSTRPPAARLTAGVVRLEGAMGGGASSFAFQLPAALRPAQSVYLPIDLCNAAKGRLLIEPTGDAFVSSEVNFADAQCFTSLEGATYVLAQQSPVTLLNGWTAYSGGTRTPAVTNVGGIIRLQGAIKTTGTTTEIFQLPSAMRPATLVYMPVDLCNAAKGRLLVTLDGKVSVSTVPGNFSAAQCFTSLEGAWFGI